MDLQAVPEFEVRASLSRVLDEVDYGILVVDLEWHVWSCNRSARWALQATGALSMVDGDLKVAGSKDASALRQAMEHAVGKGVRRLLSLQGGGQAVALAVVPLERESAEERDCCLLMLSRPSPCEQLSAWGLAHSAGLTGSERAVFLELMNGHGPLEIAELRRVSIATVRTQINGIRAKLGCASIREVMLLASTLPPLLPLTLTSDPRARSRWAA